MSGEPWCLTPAQYADLTNWQIEHVYLRPAVERTKQLRAEMGRDRPDVPPLDLGGGVEPSASPNGLPPLADLMRLAHELGADQHAIKDWHKAQTGAR